MLCVFSFFEKLRGQGLYEGSTGNAGPQVPMTPCVGCMWLAVLHLLKVKDFQDSHLALSRGKEWSHEAIWESNSFVAGVTRQREQLRWGHYTGNQEIWFLSQVSHVVT